MGTHVYTSIVANYIPKARVLAHSVKRFHPDCKFHLMLSDDVPAGFHLENEPFDSLISIADLGLANPDEWLFTHTLVEVSTGVKGFALTRILRDPTCSEVFFFDPDIVVLAPLDELTAAFGSGSVLLTPHLTEPETTEDAILDNEFSVLRHGIYNLGFVGVKNDAEGRRFAKWWSDRLRDFCFDDIPRGLFTDQRWADLVPAYFPGCRILHDPVYNVATWNLTSRKVEGTRERLTIGGRRVVFYHFSGLDSGAQEAMLNKYGSDMPVLFELREWYLAECIRMGQEEFGRLRWRYGYFDNGEPMTGAHRRLYRERGDVRRAFPNPFATADPSHSYYHWYEADSAAAAQPAHAGQGEFALQYCIVLSITTKDCHLAAETARKIQRHSRGAGQLYVAGTVHALKSVLANNGLAEAFSALEVAASDAHSSNFGYALTRLADRDILFVQAGIDVPDHWDLRLAWTAHRQAGIATVSPLCENGTASNLVVKDRLAYHVSQFALMEQAEFLTECVYVTAEAIRGVRLGLPGGDSASHGFTAFLQRTKSLRYSHLLADHVSVGRVGVCGLNGNGATVARATVLPVQVGEGLDPVIASTRPRQLHIMHSWGGGLERWVREYCRADETHANFVLKSVGTWNSFGMELRLYRRCDDVQPIQVWPLLPPIKATVTEHPAYRSALAEIVERYGIGRILISSLIGHSLDALDAKIPTLVVCHDYYPFCPALNITFGKICTACDGGRLEACTRENPHHRFFLNLPPAAWLDVRRAFLERIQSASVPMIAPSPSVRNHYIELEPGLSSAFRVVPHGTRPMGSAPLRLTFAPDRHLRVLVLGSVAPNKGLALLEEAAPKLLEFARLLLIGCGAHGQAFEQVAGVTVVPHYRWEDLPAILGELGPDVALLPSSVPETFSYTLQELSELGIPTLATNLGSFADRIQDGSDGFLCEPTANAIVATLREIASNRGMLSPIHERLSGRPRRDVSEMVAEYEALLPAPRAAERAYFCPDSRPHRSSGGSNIAQLYWRAADETYSEERSVGAEYEVRPYRQILRLPIPPRQSTLAELRFDPSGCSGLMLLHAMRLLDGTGNAAWRWREEVASVQALRRSEILVLGEAGEGRGVLLWFEKSDPQMLLPIPPLEGVRGGVFEAELTWLGSVELPSAVAASIASGDAPLLSAAECDRLIRRQDEITPGANGGPPQAPLDALERDLAAARTRVRELENSLSWRVSAPLRGIGGLVLKLGRRGVHR